MLSSTRGGTSVFDHSAETFFDVVVVKIWAIGIQMVLSATLVSGHVSLGNSERLNIYSKDSHSSPDSGPRILTHDDIS